MHFGVDAAVAFLVMILVALMFGFGIVETAVVALVIGAIAAPFTRRAELRGLAARTERATIAQEPTAPDPTAAEPTESAEGTA